MKEIHVVGGAIIEGTKVLAAQRSASMEAPYKWEFPGGKVEKDETHAEALKRELMEELGIETEVGWYLAKGNSEVDDNKIILHVYKAVIIKGIPEAREHARIKWVEIDGIEELDWADADIPACRELFKMYRDTPFKNK